MVSWKTDHNPDLLPLMILTVCHRILKLSDFESENFTEITVYSWGKNPMSSVSKSMTLRVPVSSVALCVAFIITIITLFFQIGKVAPRILKTPKKTTKKNKPKGTKIFILGTLLCFN